MPLTPATVRGSDPAVTTPMPGVRVGLHLSARTLAWLAEHPHAQRLVDSAWDTLTELERAGCPRGPIAALRRVLTHHQPTPAGRYCTCRWGIGRRRPFPCVVWHQIHGELLDLFPGTVGGPCQSRR
ncbi:MAG: hypothetical protein ACRDTA_16035 [Pseudonocardiaceae bacterium]